MYSKRLAISMAISQFINALTGGWWDETLASRAHRMRLAGNGWLANILDRIAVRFGEVDHCRKAYEYTRQINQVAPEFREKNKIG